MAFASQGKKIMKKIKSIVTGGAGFIGSNLVDQLIALEHEVIVIDNESATTNSQFYYNKSTVYNKLDVADYDAIRPLFNGVDYVFHLAAESRIQPAILNPLLAVRTNTVGTATVLQCAREAGVKKVVYSSTSSGYGLINTPPLEETMRDDCLNPYSVSKVSGEKLCKMYTDLFGLSTLTFRYFNVYGPREPAKGPYAPVVRLFLRQKSAGESLTIVGDGLQRRDFTHVNDVVKANILAMTSDQTGLFNIGTGKNHSVLELAKMISDDITFIPPRLGEARITLANNNKSKTLLGWDCTVQLEDYITKELENI
jgi:UDP-glucose 4-epimerase